MARPISIAEIMQSVSPECVTLESIYLFMIFLLTLMKGYAWT